MSGSWEGVGLYAPWSYGSTEHGPCEPWAKALCKSILSAPYSGATRLYIRSFHQGSRGNGFEWPLQFSWRFRKGQV